MTVASFNMSGVSRTGISSHSLGNRGKGEVGLIGRQNLKSMYMYILETNKTLYKTS